MWLFSDLHALEVEPWIHCFCTRLHPLIVPCWRLSYMKVFSPDLFLATTFQMFFIHMSKTNNQRWDLTELILDSELDLSSGNFLYQHFRPRRVLIEAPCLDRNLSFSSSIGFWTPNSSNVNLSKQNLLSGYFYGVSHHFLFCWVILHCLWCSDPDTGLLLTTDFVDKSEKKTVTIVEICSKTLLLFVVFSIAEPRPTLWPKEQYISGVCNYLLLTLCQVNHCIIRVSSRFQDVSGTDSLGYLLPWESVTWLEEELCCHPLVYDETSRGIVKSSVFFTFSSISQHTHKGTVWPRSEADLLTVVVTGATEHVVVGVWGALNVVVVIVSCGSWTLSQSL